MSKKIEKFFNLTNCLKKIHMRDFPGGPVVMNPPSSAGDAGFLRCRGTKIPHAAEHLSPCATTAEPAL